MKIRYTFTIIIAFAGLCSLTVSAQVGINQENPKATLDIQKSSNFATEKGKEGVLIPRLSYTELKEMTEAQYNKLEASTLVYVKEKTASEPESSNDTYKKAMKDVGEAGFYYWNPKFVLETHVKNNYRIHYTRRDIIKKWVRLSDREPREKPLITKQGINTDIRSELNSGKVLRGTYGIVEKDEKGVNYTYTGLIRIVSQLYWTEKDNEKLILKPRQDETKVNFHNGQTLYVENMPLIPIFLKEKYGSAYPDVDIEYKVEKSFIGTNNSNQIVVGSGKLIFTNSAFDCSGCNVNIYEPRLGYQPFYLFTGRISFFYRFNGIPMWYQSTLDERWDYFTSRLNNPYGENHSPVIHPTKLLNSLYAIELLPILVTEDSEIKP